MEWIKIVDQMPPDRTHVLVCNSLSPKEQPVIGFFKHKNYHKVMNWWEFCSVCNDQCFPNDRLTNITHWMPLPLVPILDKDKKLTIFEDYIF